MGDLLRRAARGAATAVPPADRLLRQRDRLLRESRRDAERLRQARARLAASREEGEELRHRLAGTEQRLAEVEEQLRAERERHRVRFVPHGHYYSPVPDLEQVQQRRGELWPAQPPAALPGVDLRADAQLSLLPRFAELYAEMPFQDQAHDGLRYGFRNGFFSYGDGLALYAMLRHLRPRRLVEVGSGWSSALTLDVVDRFLDGAVELTFVEPYPERLRSLVRDEDASRVTVVERPLHEADPSLFTGLEPGDVLFVDSTHVSKVGSDVNQLVHEVLPRLPAGVHVHVHDIFYPFEYPERWVLEGRAWNEAYVLRAWITDNARARITWFNDYLGRFHRDAVEGAMPLWTRNPGGSIWFETV
jgi:hypothetical protein